VRTFLAAIAYQPTRRLHITREYGSHHNFLIQSSYSLHSIPHLIMGSDIVLVTCLGAVDWQSAAGRVDCTRKLAGLLVGNTDAMSASEVTDVELPPRTLRP
jgi:hypothetical protein